MDKLFIVDAFERRILIDGLNHCRTEYLAENKPTDDVSQMLFRLIKARSGFFTNKNTYKIKMKDFDYRVLITVLNDYKKYQETVGIDVSETNRLLLRILDAYGV